MTYIQKAWKGIIFIVFVLFLNGFLWLSATPIFNQPLESTIAQIVGSTILLGFSIVFFLSTKNRFVNWLFSGLENVYSTHRWVAMFSLLLIFVHAQTTGLIIQYYRGDIPFDAASMGPLARNLFIALIVLALLAKYMKYEHWRVIHRLMIIPYMLSVYHAFFLSSYALIELNVLAVWMNLVVLVGIVSSVYMILIYRKTAFIHKGIVKKVEKIANNVTEIAVDMANIYDFKNGQFTFIKINKAPFKGIAHPFSISGSKGSTIYFTIKGLGDFTKDLPVYLKAGDKLQLTRSYGHMTFDDYTSPQVWIAGGIGITPFLSHLRSNDFPKQSIDLYYSVRNKSEAVHLGYLKSLHNTLDNFTLHYSESETDGYLSVDNIAINNDTSVFMCGPVGMAKSLKKQLYKTKQHKTLVYEAFSFTGTLAQDVENLSRRVLKKIKSPS